MLPVSCARHKGLRFASMAAPLRPYNVLANRGKFWCQTRQRWRSPTLLITRQSLISGITRTLEIPLTTEQLESWQSGIYIQDAMPELEPVQREFLMTGITADEWNELPEL